MGCPKGFRHTEATKMKMSLAQKGKPKPWQKGRVSWNKGKGLWTPEIEKAYMKKYREEHKKERAEYLLINREKLLKQARESSRIYRSTHPWVAKEKYKIAKKIWHEKNKERRYAEYKEYRKANPDKMRIRDYNRSCLEKSAGKLTVKTLQEVYEANIKKYGTLTCYLCLEPIEFKKDHLEHKIPLSRGGTNRKENLDIACNKCNLSKKNKTESEYKDWLKLVGV